MILKEQFFPTTLYGKDLQLDNKLFEEEIFQWMKEDPVGLTKTNMGGWHSQTDLHTRPTFKPLVDEIYKMQREVYEEEWLDREPILGNMWANVNEPGGYNRPHVHPNSLFSGCYYVKTPPNCGKFIANDPRPGIQVNMPTRKKGQPPKHLWREAHIDVQAGRVLMFPSWLWHNVETNNSNEIRISIAFNFIQSGFQPPMAGV